MACRVWSFYGRHPRSQDSSQQRVARTPARRVRLPVGEFVASPREVATLLHPLLAHEPVEVFSVLCLSVKHRVVGYAPISRGTLDGTVAHPREVFRVALMAPAASICLAHNHPSGDPSPSPDDDHLTARLVACGELMGIEVVDHIVLGGAAYLSYREAGRLERLSARP